MNLIAIWEFYLVVWQNTWVFAESFPYISIGVRWLFQGFQASLFESLARLRHVSDRRICNRLKIRMISI